MLHCPKQTERSLCCVLCRLVDGGKFVLGFVWACRWRQVCVRFCVGLQMEGSLCCVLCSVLCRLVHGGKFVLGFVWTCTWRQVCVRFCVGLYMEGSLCQVLCGLVHGGKFVLGSGRGPSCFDGEGGGIDRTSIVKQHQKTATFLKIMISQMTRTYRHFFKWLQSFDLLQLKRRVNNSQLFLHQEVFQVFSLDKLIRPINKYHHKKERGN